MQTIISGNGKINALKDILAGGNHVNPFVIMGEHLRRQQAALLPFEHHTWFKKDINVLQHEIEACSIAFTTARCSCIIAIGGGSVIDLAKAVVHTTATKDTAQPFFICIPTTAGSGSEATQFAVIYVNRVKYSLDAPMLLPRVVVLDPGLTNSLPALQTAVSGIDALAQAIESYWNVHADDTSRELAANAIRLLLIHLPVALTAPTADAREKTMWAAHLAGRAINITRTTAPHALSYFLSADYNIPHGQAVALFLPLFFLYNNNINQLNCNPSGNIITTKKALQDLCGLLSVNSPAACMEYLKDFIKKAGLATTLTELGIDKYEITGSLLNNINEQRFSNNPVLFNRDILNDLCLQHL